MKSHWDRLPDDIKTIIFEYNAAQVIQTAVYKMFYKKYGLNWENLIRNYQADLDYYCYRHDINDPWQDYSEYYRVSPY